MYSDLGPESVAPEGLIRASMLQVLFTIRSERQVVEQIRYNILYRWFVDLEINDAPWHTLLATLGGEGENDDGGQRDRARCGTG